MSRHYNHKPETCSTTNESNVVNMSSHGPSEDERNNSGRNDGKAGKNIADDLLTEEMSQGIDVEAAGVGLVIADLFKTVSLAAVHLPNMELYSDMIGVVVDDDSITVSIAGLNPETETTCDSRRGKTRCHGCCANDPGYEVDDDNLYDDEVEGLIYDGD
jgi:hypothetical protein